jgi:ABC-type multidrug transport system permease subunit
MVVWSIAFNNIKRVFSNFAMILVLIILPISQIVIMQTIMDGVAPVTVTAAPIDKFIDVFVLGKAINLPMIQLFAGGTIVEFLLIGGVIAAAMIIAQKEDKTFMRMFTCPLRFSSIIIGNLIGMSITIFIVAAAFLAVTFLFLGISWGSSWLNVLIVTAAITYVAVALGLLASALFKSVKIGAAFLSFFIITMQFLSDSFTFSGNFDATSKFTINKWAYDAYNKLMEGQTLNSILTNLLVLGIIGTVMVIAAILLYRRERIYE